MRLALALAALCAGCAPAPVQATPETPEAVRLEFTGEWRQGALIRGRTAPGAVMQINGKAVRVSADGHFVFGLDRDEGPEAVLEVSLGDAKARREFRVAARSYDIQRIDGLPQAQVTPPPEALKRIAADIARVRKARERDSEHTEFARDFIWPAVGRISGVFGSQRILNGVPKQPHYGVDVAAPVGTRVIAPAGGVVSLAAPDMYYTGGTLMIDHGHGLSSAFLHLSKIHVKEGQVVKQGERIGEIGATGRATGPHLDWRMNWFDARVDPQLLVGPMPEREPAP
jgi:murein DD-endopeptidase MepM/ murein hydrolase activator NlpD